VLPTTSMRICLKISLLWKSSHFLCKLIPGHVFLLFFLVPKDTLSFRVNSFSFECLALYSHKTHVHIYKIHISTYMNSNFFSKLNKGSTFSLHINLYSSFYSTLKLSSLAVHDWNYTEYLYSILHKLSSRSCTIGLILHPTIKILGLHCCTIILGVLN